MTNAQQKQQRQNSSGDSLFGMALAQAFTAIVLGPAADLAWEAAEITSAVYEDRMDARRKNDSAQTHRTAGLMDFFNSVDKKTIAEREQAQYRPSYQSSFAHGPVFSF